MDNRAATDFFRTAVTDIGSLIQPYVEFFFEVFAGLVTGRTGCAFDAAQDNLSAGICLPAVIAVGTEVFGIIESPFMIPIREPVSPDFF